MKYPKDVCFETKTDYSQLSPDFESHWIGNPILKAQKVVPLGKIAS